MRGAWLLAVMLAGCMQGAPMAASPEAPGAAVIDQASSWNVTAVAANTNGQREAAVSVSEDGQVILTCMHGNFEGPITVMASTDAGSSWKPITMPLDTPASGDCETAIRADGAWAFAAPHATGISVVTTTDQGVSWRVDHQVATGILAIQAPYSNLDRPWIEFVDDELWLFWMNTKDVPGQVYVRRSGDLGASWGPVAVIGSPSAQDTNVRNGHPVVADGVHVPMLRYLIVREDTAATGGRVLQIASTPTGDAWGVEDVLIDKRLVPDWPALAVTEDGHWVLVFTYTLDSGARGAAWMVRPPGGTWSAARPLHDPGDADVTWPWVSGGLGSHALAVFPGADVNGTRHLWVAQLDAAEHNATVTPLHAGRVEFASVDHDGQGRPFAAFTLSDDATYIARRIA